MPRHRLLRMRLARIEHDMVSISPRLGFYAKLAKERDMVRAELNTLQST